MRKTLTIAYDDDVLDALNLSPGQFGKELKMLAAVKLYELGRLSSGAAANLADIPKPEFLRRLSDYGAYTFCLTEEELLQDLADARKVIDSPQ